MSPRRGLKLPTTIDIRKDIEADGQHKTRIIGRERWMTRVVRRFCLSKHMIGMILMSKKSDKEKIAGEICKAAKLYKEHLVGKRFIYVFDDRYIEVLYKNINFKHLTGVECNMSAKDFYRNALKGRLQGTQIYFTKDHPYSLCKRKVKHLCDISILAGSENFMLEEIVTNSRTYKFGTTDLRFSLCMNKEHDETGKEKGECYIVESLRDEDCFSKSRNVYTVTHILSKSNTVSSYTDILFIDKNTSLRELPDTVLCMLDEKLL